MNRKGSRAAATFVALLSLGLAACYSTHRVPTPVPPLSDSIEAQVGCCMVMLHHPTVVADTLLTGWARIPKSGSRTAREDRSLADSTLLNVPLMRVERVRNNRRTAVGITGLLASWLLFFGRP